MEIIKELLLQKKQLFKEYGDILLLMLDSDVDDMEDHLGSLENAKEGIDKIDKEIEKRLSQMGEDGKNLLSDIKNRSNRDEISDERKEIFDISQEIFSVISGYGSLMEQISLKAKRFRSEAMENIEKVNDAGKGAKYLKSFNTSLDSGTFLNIKK